VGGILEVQIEALGPQHVREGFDCGHDRISQFCREEAHDAHCAYEVRVFVAVEPGSNHVVGFYSLAMRHLNGGNKRGYIPALYLAMLGVCADHQNQTVGTQLITNAFERSVRVSEDVGAQILWLEATDDGPFEYYKSLGFSPLKANSRKMTIQLATLRSAEALA
jgi:predicted N-acetyltransferase YhbS